ncbi:hypothetical protein ACFFRR_009609 [Megaselia abdita]
MKLNNTVENCDAVNLPYVQDFNSLPMDFEHAIEGVGIDIFISVREIYLQYSLSSAELTTKGVTLKLKFVFGNHLLKDDTNESIIISMERFILGESNNNSNESIRWVLFHPLIFYIIIY